MRSFLIFVLLIFLVYSSHALLGLTTLQQCEALATSSPNNLADIVNCYHLAAMTQAYLDPSNSPADTSASGVDSASTATSICEIIVTEYVNGGSSLSDDQKRAASEEANACFADVARITGDSSACSNIESYDPSNTFASTDTSSQTISFNCITAAHQTALQRAGVNSLTGTSSSSTNPTCTPLFILIPLMISVFLKNRKN